MQDAAAMDTPEILQQLHDREINCELSCLFDCGWRWWRSARSRPLIRFRRTRSKPRHTSDLCALVP
jgi:hypothetical protein